MGGTTSTGNVPSASDGRRGRGRRPGGEDTRQALLTAAREVFGEQGFDGATVRMIATKAGVDPAMVNHWFGGKRGLFSATIQAPAELPQILREVLAGDPATLAERLVRAFATVWDSAGNDFTAIVRSMSSQEEAAMRAFRDFVSTVVFGPVIADQHIDHPELRAALCATQMIGLGMVRYVLKLEPLAGADVETVVAAVAPTIRRYLTADLGQLNQQGWPISPSLGSGGGSQLSH